MLNQGVTDYPLSDDNGGPTCDQSIQKWVGMVNRCLEQQWKDSQDLLGCAKTLKNSSHLVNRDDVIKELNSIGLDMMQRSINLRQELVDNAYLTGPCNSYADISIGDSLSQCQKRNPSAFSSFSSSPSSDIYEHASSKHYKGLDENKRMSTTSGCYSPFTIHSKLWQQKRSTLSSSPSIARPNTASSPVCDNPQHKSNFDASASGSIPACAYNYYPQTSTPAPTRSSKPVIQCQQCYFCRSSTSRETTRSTRSDSSSLISSSSSFDDPSPTEPRFTAAAVQHADSDHNFYASSSSPLLRKLIKSPSILIPTHTTSCLNPPPKTTRSTPPSLASHITPSTPSSSSSMVHTMSTKFHFKRSETSTFACSLAQDSPPPRSVRSLISRKVSFPTLFTSKKVHPSSSSSNIDTLSVEASFFT